MSYLCSNPWTTLFVWGNGSITHCCYSNFGSVGNIKNSSLTETWQGEKMNFIRKQIKQGKYLNAGCEYFCRSFRWQEFYGHKDNAPAIPEGLGRNEHFNPEHLPLTPVVLGIGIDWICNLHCSHCLSSRRALGLEEKYFAQLIPYIKKSRIFRFMGGEFSINPKCLRMIRKISTWEDQPTLFFSSNGQVGIDRYMDSIRSLQSLHLKFSLENLGEEYARIRRGGSWELFRSNLLRARAFFNSKKEEGYNWQLFLNFCVMRSNIEQLPQVFDFAMEHNIPLVLNTINGMRHLDENMFMYHTNLPEGRIEEVIRDCRQRLDKAGNYHFTPQLRLHLDYIHRVANHHKLNLTKIERRLVPALFKGHKREIVFYSLYKLKRDKPTFFLYLLRKFKARISKVLPFK